MTEMTERQAKAWPDAIAEIQRYVTTSTVTDRIDSHDWTVSWEEEFRPGRGQALRAMWCDGEYVASVYMDVYGSPSIAVAELSWVHNSGDEECACEACAKEREDDER